NRPGYVRMLRQLVALDRSLLIVHYNRATKLGKHRRIDVWWGGLQGNGGLMLLTAYLITAHNRWSGASVIIRTIVDDEAQRERALSGIQAITASARVQGEAAVLLRDGRTIAEIMHAESAG